MKPPIRHALIGVAATAAAACAPFQEPASTSSRDGYWLYKKACASCHGMAGDGNPPVGPLLRDGAFLRERSVDDVKQVIRAGRTGDTKRYGQYLRVSDGYGNMPGFDSRVLSDEQLDALAAWLKHGMLRR